MNLSAELMKGLGKMGFETPSPVQEAAIAPMLAGRDLLVQAPTGTGKTAAFGIPVVEGVEPGSQHIQTVILCPTRELAVQIASVLKQLTACKQGIRTLALYGGEPIGRQITALKRRPQIIVATPGRMMDHMRRHTVRLNQVGCLVLDEADRMLDMGFREDIATIAQSLPEERQTVLFSATLSPEVKGIATAYQRDALPIRVGAESIAAKRVEQYYLEVIKNAKSAELVDLLEERQFGLSLVFVSTKTMADQLAKQLTESGHPADALHGDLRQIQRDKVMRRYRDGKTRILVATDVAARGIDVTGIDAVVNYDVPQDSDSYIHRIGRTGRAGQGGMAFTFIYAWERSRIRDIMADTKASILPVRPEQAFRPERPASPAAKRAQHGRPKRQGYDRHHAARKRSPA